MLFYKHLFKPNVLKTCKRYFGISARKFEFIPQKKFDDNDEILKVVEEPGPYQIIPPLGWDGMLEAWERWKAEMKDALRGWGMNQDFTNVPDIIKRHQQFDIIIYYFRSKKDVDHWFMMNDQMSGGKSWCEFTLGDNGLTSVFRGYLNQHLPAKCLPPLDSTTEYNQDGYFHHYYKGYCLLQTMPFMVNNVMIECK